MTNVLTNLGAVNQALGQLMEKDKSVLVLGEDVGKNGGVFRATEGLWKKHKNRVIDTPLAESGIVGTSVGLALTGWKPVAEIQFSGFLYLAHNQLVSHAARYRLRSQGACNCLLGSKRRLRAESTNCSVASSMARPCRPRALWIYRSLELTGSLE